MTMKFNIYVLCCSFLLKRYTILRTIISITSGNADYA